MKAWLVTLMTNALLAYAMNSRAFLLSTKKHAVNKEAAQVHRPAILDVAPAWYVSKIATATLGSVCILLATKRSIQRKNTAIIHRP